MFTIVTFRGTEKFSQHRDSRGHSHSEVVNMLALREILAKRPESRKVRFVRYHVSIACYFLEIVNPESTHPSQITWMMICTRKNQAKFELMSSSKSSIFSDPKLTRHSKSTHAISLSSLHHRLRYITLQCLKDSPLLQGSWFRYFYAKIPANQCKQRAVAEDYQHDEAIEPIASKHSRHCYRHL